MSFHFLHNQATGEMIEGRIGPHDEAHEKFADGFVSVATDLDEVPPWFPHHAVYEGGQLRKMTSQEKAQVDAERETAERTREFNSNRALHSIFTVFLDEINALRQAGGLAPLDADNVKG